MGNNQEKKTEREENNHESNFSSESTFWPTFVDDFYEYFAHEIDLWLYYPNQI